MGVTLFSMFFGAGNLIFPLIWVRRPERQRVSPEIHK